MSSPGGHACTAVSSGCTVTGLDDFTTYSFNVTATNEVGQSASSTTNEITLSGDEASATLKAPAEADTDTVTTLNAQESTSLSGNIAKYEWDYGNGQFTEGPAVTQYTWAQPGTKTLRVRVTSFGGMIDTATAIIVVYQRALRETGVSINSGAAFTQTRDVTVTLGWPARAQQVRISNDGGFAGAATYDVQDNIDWVLDDSVNVVATQVVYVRYIGPGLDPTRTLTDDIIFDNTPPDVAQATATIGTRAAQKAASALTAKKTQTWRIKVKASDDRSGLARLQFSKQRNGAAAHTQPYRMRTNLKTSKTKQLFVRVSDKAGNWARWRLVKTRKR